jgi:hypothetical protein
VEFNYIREIQPMPNRTSLIITRQISLEGSSTCIFIQAKIIEYLGEFRNLMALNTPIYNSKSSLQIPSKLFLNK